ncbi:MAG TPA: hypothetical protein VKS78_11080 [Roseiarcus sp.]|nr:hypothetical protein [Roseiarcus sp.]
MRSLSYSAIAAALLIATAALAGAASAQTPRRVLVPCSYPHGWNSTDASRELRGTPNGLDHQCVVEYGADGRAHYEDSTY